MVAKITTGKDVYGALAYNQQKVDRGKGKVLLTHILREPPDGRFDIATTAEDLLRWMPSHYRTEKPVVHISLNPDPEDRLAAELLTEIAEKYMERMGWGEQPYIVFEHTDIDRRHIHIVSVQVGQDGHKVKDGRRNERSVAVTEELEREYGLHPAKERKRTEDWRLTAVDCTKGNLKRQIGAVVKPAAAMYRFQTLGEFRALLSQYNIGVEEVRGERDGTPYRGLLYTALDTNGDKAAAAPLKSSLFGKAVNKKGQLKSSIIIDELPTIYFKGLDNLIATARSNKVATLLGFQDFSQLKRDYGDKEAAVVMNTVGNIFSGQVVGETAKTLSERFGKVLQKRQSMTINRNDTSTSISTQMDSLIPQSKISTLTQGMFVGAVADNFDERIDQKIFHAEIVVDSAKVKAETVKYRKIPLITDFTDEDGNDRMKEVVQENYERIKAEASQIVAEELERIKNDPVLCKLLPEQE